MEKTLSEFCFMDIENDKNIEENNKLQQAFEDFYHESITLAKKNKEMKNMIEAMAQENKELKEKVANLKKDLSQSISINKELKLELKENVKEMIKLLGGTQKLSNILLNQKSFLCKLGLGGEHH